eukprot:15329746-Ditylum_brightwellii.AAC.1
MKFGKESANKSLQFSKTKPARTKTDENTLARTVATTNILARAEDNTRTEANNKRARIAAQKNVNNSLMKTGSLAGELRSKILVNKKDLDMLDDLCGLVDEVDLDEDDMSISDEEETGINKEDMDWQYIDKSDSEKGDHKNRIMDRTESRHPTKMRHTKFYIGDWK